MVQSQVCKICEGSTFCRNMHDRKVDRRVLGVYHTTYTLGFGKLATIDETPPVYLHEHKLLRLSDVVMTLVDNSRCIVC